MGSKVFRLGEYRVRGSVGPPFVPSYWDGGRLFVAMLRTKLWRICSFLQYLLHLGARKKYLAKNAKIRICRDEKGFHQKNGLLDSDKVFVNAFIKFMMVRQKSQKSLKGMAKSSVRSQMIFNCVW